jgi:Uma2 family endonuclease
MGLPQPIHRCTPEEYLRLERDASEKHEFYRGEVFAMSRGTSQHSLVIANVIGELRQRLKGSPCRVYDSNLRIRIPRTTLYTYPDVSVICGPLQFDRLDTQRHTVLNPTLIVEVLSPSTEAWDRGGKLESYIQIESLREYLLVSSTAARVEAYLRLPNGTWNYSDATGLQAQIALGSLQSGLPLAEVYAGVTFPAPPSDPAAPVSGN